jgi:hypothetical protein
LVRTSALVPATLTELFVIFLSPYRQILRQYFIYDTATTFGIIFGSSFVYHPELYEYNLITDSVIK